MKMPIKWHKECFGNMKENLFREEADLVRARARVDRARDAVEFYAEQIAEAEAKHKDGFDSDKFMRKVRYTNLAKCSKC